MEKLKLWFKHKDGFIKIDETFIYFTQSGNWQDAYDQPLYNLRKDRLNITTVVFYAAFLTFTVFILYASLNNRNATLFTVVSVGFAIYQFYSKHNRFKNASYKVYNSSITNIIIESDRAEIEFKSEEKVITKELNNIGPQGIVHLLTLKEYLFETNEEMG